MDVHGLAREAETHALVRDMLLTLKLVAFS